MSNISPFDEYTTFSIEIASIKGTANGNTNDIINSSQVSAEGGVNDGYGDGDDFFN